MAFGAVLAADDPPADGAGDRGAARASADERLAAALRRLDDRSLLTDADAVFEPSENNVEMV